MNEKTMADVLDKSIDKLSGGAAEIAKAAKQVAPHAWEVAVRQQAVEGVADALTGAVCLVAIVVLARLAMKHRRRLDDAGALEVAMLLGAFATVVLFGVGVCELRDGLLQVANPEYYAAKAILEAVK